MSPFALTIHHGHYLHLVATGDARLSDLLGLVDMAVRIAKVDGDKRVLADLISINVLFSDEEYRQLQVYAVKSLFHLERLAYTVPACYQEGKGEPPALSGGVTVRTFSDLRQALEWVSR